MPTLASCTFDKHGLILIIFGKQRQRTFKNYTYVQLSLSLYFYLLYYVAHYVWPYHETVRMSVCPSHVISRKRSQIEP